MELLSQLLGQGSGPVERVPGDTHAHREQFGYFWLDMGVSSSRGGMPPNWAVLFGDASGGPTPLTPCFGEWGAASRSWTGIPGVPWPLLDSTSLMSPMKWVEGS